MVVCILHGNFTISGLALRNAERSRESVRPPSLYPGLVQWKVRDQQQHDLKPDAEYKEHDLLFPTHGGQSPFSRTPAPLNSWRRRGPAGIPDGAGIAPHLPSPILQARTTIVRSFTHADVESELSREIYLSS